MLIPKSISKIFVRQHFRKHVDKEKSSKTLRNKFVEYFVDKHNHTMVRSSPVIPFCDPSLAFVNSGMNQFKNVFMGKKIAPQRRVCNYQKCIRVGGKHNDLNMVGKDGSHHTFFEMLGNWSFGDYFKKEACEMAWNLLTQVYRIPPSRLYVTYYKGDKQLGIDEDTETKEIWKSLKLSEDRILGFGSKENFWEMGVIGPCGPCTEIHIDHLGPFNRAQFVNKGLHDLTELWNIVFIQYKRNADGNIEILPQKHVDTGMGFERLTAVMQGKLSNYDTDNFTYLLSAIHKNCKSVPEYAGKFGESDWNHLDASYRILCDHSRMITVCLADGAIPEQNQKLRRILRKAFLLSESVFGKQRGLLKELSNYVIDHMGSIYEEMERHSKQIHQIIDFEEEVYKEFRRTAIEEWHKIVQLNANVQSLDIIESPNLVAGFKELKSHPNLKTIDGKLAFKLYDAFGLARNTIHKLANALHLEFDKDSLENELQLARNRSRITTDTDALMNAEIFERITNFGLDKTDDSAKYDYAVDNAGTSTYIMQPLPVQVLQVLKQNELVNEIELNQYCALIFDKTNFYTDAGGQISDKGRLVINNDAGIFQIAETHNCDGYILHKGFLVNSSGPIKLNNLLGGNLHVDNEYRSKIMKNHTALHLLNAVIKQVKGVTSQKSSKVTDAYFNLDVGIFSHKKLNASDVDKIEQIVRSIIKENCSVHFRYINSNDLMRMYDVTLIPGEIYPETGIRMVEILSPDKDTRYLSREPCCGTHVLNTGHLDDFCIIGVKSLGRSTMQIHGVTSHRAKMARVNGIEMWDSLERFERSIRDNLDKSDQLLDTVNKWQKKLHFKITDPGIIPFVTKAKCLETLQKISKYLKTSSKDSLRQFIEIEMQNALESSVCTTKKRKLQYLVHYLRSSMILETVPLQRATKMCSDIPVMLISYSDHKVKARCCVPKKLCTKDFDAEKWLTSTVAQVFKSDLLKGKGQNTRFISNMKEKRVSIQKWDLLLQESLHLAKKFIDEQF